MNAEIPEDCSGRRTGARPRPIPNPAATAEGQRTFPFVAEILKLANAKLSPQALQVLNGMDIRNAQADLLLNLVASIGARIPDWELMSKPLNAAMAEVASRAREAGYWSGFADGAEQTRTEMRKQFRSLMGAEPPENED